MKSFTLWLYTREEYLRERYIVMECKLPPSPLRQRRRRSRLPVQNSVPEGFEQYPLTPSDIHDGRVAMTALRKCCRFAASAKSSFVLRPGVPGVNRQASGCCPSFPQFPLLISDSVYMILWKSICLTFGRKKKIVFRGGSYGACNAGDIGSRKRRIYSSACIKGGRNGRKRKVLPLLDLRTGDIGHETGPRHACLLQ